MTNWQGTRRRRSFEDDNFLFHRYLFVLQLKDDIRTGKLECPSGTDLELGALSMQGRWWPNTFSAFSRQSYWWWTIPSLIDVNWRREVIWHTFFRSSWIGRLHQWWTYSGNDLRISSLTWRETNRGIRRASPAEMVEQQVNRSSTSSVFEHLSCFALHRGLTPADCEIQYLNKARWLEMYGVDLHTVMGKDGLEYKLGLTPTGILVFENRIKIGLFVWWDISSSRIANKRIEPFRFRSRRSKVTRIDFNRNKLTIVVVEDDDNDPTLQRDFVFLFRCYDEKQCKHFWKCSMEYHIFFRTTSAAKVKQGAKSNLARTGSRFRFRWESFVKERRRSMNVGFSGRTECQAATLGNLARRSMNFERKASQRFSRRASYAIRKKIQEHETLREQEDERLKKLKSDQEAKLDETKKSPE